MAHWLLTFSFFCAFQACFESTLIPATDTDAVDPITNLQHVIIDSDNIIRFHFIANSDPNSQLSTAAPNSSFKYRIKLTGAQKTDVINTVTFKVLINEAQNLIPNESNPSNAKAGSFEGNCDKNKAFFNIKFSSESVAIPFTLIIPPQINFVKEYVTKTPEPDTFLTFEYGDANYDPTSPRKVWRIVGISMIALVLFLCASAVAIFVCYKHRHEMLHLQKRNSEFNSPWTPGMRSTNALKRRRPVATKSICPSSSEDSTNERIF